MARVTLVPRTRTRIADNRFKESTKSRHNSKVKWLQNHHPTCVNENWGEKAFDMNAMFNDFFEHIWQKVQKNGTYFDPPKYQSFQHVSGYNSAIKYHFKKNKVLSREEWANQISDFLGGYERLIAVLKRDGVIPMTEGKIPLSFSGYIVLLVKQQSIMVIIRN